MVKLNKWPIWIKEMQELEETGDIWTQDLFLDLTNKKLKDTEDIKKHRRSIKIDDNLEVTILDLFNIDFDEKEQIIDFIKDRLNIDIKEKAWIEKINLLLNKSIEYYEKRYLRTLPVSFKKIKFWTIDSIIKFIKDTRTNKKTGAIHCLLRKTSYVINEVTTNPKIKRAKPLDKEFVERKLQIPLQITESLTDKSGNIYKKWKIMINDKIINFSIITRTKWIESIIWKEISDPKYHSVDDFHDLVWSTFYIEKKEDTILLMQYIDQYIFWWEAIIDNKNAIKEEDIDKYTENINEEFVEKLLYSIKTTKKKNTTSDDYSEIKLKWKVPLALETWENASLFPIWTEIKFVIWWQDNEKWLNLHSIYDYQKRFKESTRLWIPIKEIDIRNYVNDFFENIDISLKKKNKVKEIYYEELFIDLKNKGFIKDRSLWKKLEKNEQILAFGLYKYFKSKLDTYEVNNRKYYMDERYLKISRNLE